MNMDIRRRDSRNKTPRQSASGPGTRPGPKPTVDADSDSYRLVSVRMSDEFSAQLKLAATLSGVTQREFIIRALQPAVDQILREHNLGLGAATG